MICADFLAGAHATSGDPSVVLNAVIRTYHLLKPEQQVEFLTRIQRRAA